MKYVPALPLPAAVVTYQIGQWFKRPNGTLTQYVGTRTTQARIVLPTCVNTHSMRS